MPKTRKPSTFRAVIDRWPSQAALADDVGVSEVRVQMWAFRDSVPPRLFPGLVTAAKRRGIEGITLELLFGLVPGKESRRPPRRPTERAVAPAE
jgi:hypothetical protein